MMEGEHEEVLALYPDDPEGEERGAEEEKKDDENTSILDQKSDQPNDEETQNQLVCAPTARIQSEFFERKEQEEKLRYVNAGGNFFTGVDVDSKEAAERRILRAKRFGISQSSTPSSLPSQDKLQQRAKKFGIQSAGELTSFPPLPTEGEVRLEAVHLHGTDEMSNKDVLGYFRAYGPRNVEWINDSSCNIVWDDPQSARRALCQLGKDTLTNMEEGEHLEEEGSGTPVLRWRVGVAHPRASQILLRYATTVDKKQLGAAKESQYYKKYGNPNEVFEGRKRSQPDLRKRIGYKRRASSMEAESEKEEKEEEKKGTEEEKKGTEEVKEEPMEVEPALPLTKKPRTLYSDMEGVRKETNLEKEEDEEEKESGDLRKKLQRKRIRKGNLKKRMGPRHILQNVD